MLTYLLTPMAPSPRFLPLLALLFVIPLAACAGNEDVETDEPMTEEPIAPAPMPAQNAVEVSLTNGAIEMPAQIEAGPTTFSITNNGSGAHGFAIEGGGMSQALAAALEPGGSATLDVDLPVGTYRVHCPDMPAMTMDLRVVAAGM